MVAESTPANQITPEMEEQVDALLEDLDALNEKKNTALHWACLNGRVVKTLILAGANISVLNSHERTPIDEALSRGKMDVIDAINTARCSIGAYTSKCVLTKFIDYRARMSLVLLSFPPF